MNNVNLDNQPMGQFRSRLNTLPLDLKCAIGEIPLQKGMRASSRKEKVIELFKQFNIPFLEVGTGTNRFIIKYDGYAVKIALDNEGIADNKQEWVMSPALNGAAKAHEISRGGHLLVANYRPAFTSLAEMHAYATEIKKILRSWGSLYLLGDVGISKLNYANWGLAPDGRPECIDYAYVFPVSSKIFKCVCGCERLTFTDTTYTEYKCPECGKYYADRDLRNRISQEERIRLFNNMQGIEMRNAIEQHPIKHTYVKIDNNPDLPDPYESAMVVARDMMGGVY